MVISMIGPAAGSAVATEASQNTDVEQVGGPELHTQPSIDTIEIRDNLSVWERAGARPAIVDRSDAATTVDSPLLQVEREDGEIASISTDQDGVFNTDQTVRFDLEPRDGANTRQLDDSEEFRVLIAHVDTDRSLAEEFLDAQNVSVDEVEDALEGVDGFDDFKDDIEGQDEVRFSDVRDLFEGTDEFEQFAEELREDQDISIDRLADVLTSDEFLDIVSFKAVNAGEIGSDGEASIEHDLDEPGPYLFVGHTGGEVLEEGDERPTFNDTTVLGVDAVTAQAAASTLTLQEDEVESGNNVTVDVESNLGAENVSHAVVVFDEETVADQTVVTNLTAEASTDLRSEDVIIESTIASTQGVTNIQSNAQIRGTQFADERFDGTRNLEDDASRFFSVRNAIVDGFDIRDRAGDAAQYDAIGTTTLNASITAIGGGDDEAEIDVETLEEWEAGEYTVVHVATDEDTGEISTIRESVTIVEDIGEVDPDPNDVVIDNPAVNETEIEEGDTVQVSADVTNNGPVPITVTATVTIDGTPSTDSALTRDVTVAAGATETVTFDVPRDTAGEFSLGIQFIHDGQEIGTVTAPQSVTVSEPPRRVGGGGGITVPVDEPGVVAEPPEPPAEVDVELEETVDIEFDEEAGTSRATFSDDNNVESVTFNFQTSGTVNARNLDREPDETGPSPGASVRVSQITVGEELRNQPATVQMRVSLDRLEEVGADADDLRINRYNADEGEWQGLETEPLGQTDTHVRVEAETPGFSYFSVSATSEPTAAIDAPAEVEEGDEVTFDGSASEDEYGEIVSYEWTVDGESLSGETATTTLENPGDVDVELTVTNDAGETDTTSATISVLEEDVDDGVEDPDDGPSTILGVFVILLVIVLGVGGALYAQRRNE